MHTLSKERNPYFIIEKKKEILTYKNKLGEPVWFYMRRFILELLDEKTVGKYLINDTREKKLSKILKYYVRSIIHNVSMSFHLQKSKVVFYSVYQAIYIDDHYVNKYSEPYVEAIDEYSLTIESPPLDWNWDKNRRNKNVIFSCPNLLLSDVKARLYAAIKQNNNSVESLLNYVSTRVEENLNIKLSDAEKQSIVHNTIKAMTRAQLHSKWIKRKCKEIEAKCLIMIGASYLWNSAIVRKLKNDGIKVADLQHGFIFKDNLVYDVSDDICMDEELRASTPDFFLSYGKWWNDQTNLPYAEKIPLGNPYRDEKMLTFEKKDNKNVVLVIGTGVNTDDHILLASKLKEKISEKFNVVFRPHPTERIYTKNKFAQNRCEVELDCDNDLYDMLAKTNILIAKSSTVLFEACGLVDKIIVWNDYPGQMFFEGDFFEHFDSFDELLQIIQRNSMVAPDFKFWELNCIKNFMDFYNKI